MLPVKNVELTKVHYFEPTKYHRNFAIPTISREVHENTFNRNVIIKKNIFGHKWVLKINELENGTLKKRSRAKCWIYSAVFLCILSAMFGSIFVAFDLEKAFFTSCIHKKIPNTSNNISGSDHPLVNQNGRDGTMKKTGEENSTQEIKRLQENNFNKSYIISPSPRNETKKTYCLHCTNNEVCLKTEETEKPKCMPIIDKQDPTGCGGICLLDVEFCAILDKKHKVFQCSPLKNLLKCPPDTFNCGEQCISRKKVCDGVVHCRDMLDERNCECNLEENFLCTNSTFCLPKSKKCDGVIDCWDRSDESLCYKGCPPQEFSCLNGPCIPRVQFCDGIVHCSDSSDEPQGCQV